VNYLFSQIALCLVLVGLLGMLLGWWLGRLGARRRLSDTEADWEQRLTTSQAEGEESDREAQRVAGQLAETNVELEESQDRLDHLAANLKVSEEQLVSERERITETAEELSAHEVESGELRTEIETWRDDVATLQRDQLVSQEEVERLQRDLRVGGEHAADLEQRFADLEHGVAREGEKVRELGEQLEQRTGELEQRTGEGDELRGEIARLREVKDEFQSWMQGAARKEEELSYAKHQLGTVGTLEGDLGQLRSQLEQLRRENAASGTAAEQARREAEARRAETEQQNQQIAAYEGQIVQRDRRITGIESRVAERESQIAERESRIAELEAEANARSTQAATELQDLRSELARCTTRSQDFELRAEAAEETGKNLAVELENLLAAPLVDVDRLATVRPAAQPEFSAPVAATPKLDEPELLEAPRGAADDLKRIRGIGPVLERTLNTLGIYHFRQVASWSPSDIAWVASHIDTFPDRIARDGWLLQAAELAQGPSSEEE